MILSGIEQCELLTLKWHKIYRDFRSKFVLKWKHTLEWSISKDQMLKKFHPNAPQTHFNWGPHRSLAPSSMCQAKEATLITPLAHANLIQNFETLLYIQIYSTKLLVKNK